MAFPTFSITTTADGNSTGHNLALPAAIAGDLVIVSVAVDNDLTTSTAISGGEFTKIAEPGTLGGFAHHALFKRIVTGAESWAAAGGNVTITHSTSQACSAHIYLIRGSSGNIEWQQLSGGPASSTFNPPAVTPTWGAKDTLWIVSLCRDLWLNVPTYPTNYVDGTHSRWPNTGDGVTKNSARRNLNAASEDPGNFTANGDVANWSIFTIAVEPATPLIRSSAMILG